MNFLQIKLTQGNINQGHFYLQDCRNFFPAARESGLVAQFQSRTAVSQAPISLS
ncbi:hypothetical protein [Aeromonas sp. QDB18]|uniref:hypothetical protein n=1 Tax=Aeromonas sp. QDB18 TaxID=2990486 RepID=UPI0022E29A66|nr:hypothetical protein [Aeromonas sp. QDB18]